MQVASPSCQWPAVLEERGPPEDPSILLTGEARIGDSALQVVAIRIRPELRRTPDYRANLPNDCYRVKSLDIALEAMLEETEYIVSDFEEPLGESQLSIVDLASGRYMVWVVPAAFGS